MAMAAGRPRKASSVSLSESTMSRFRGAPILEIGVDGELYVTWKPGPDQGQYLQWADVQLVLRQFDSALAAEAEDRG